MSIATHIHRREFLLDEYQKFCKAYEHFVYSYQDVASIDISSSNNQSELVRIEALTARFERMVDLFLNKVVRMIVLSETGSDEGTIRDKLLSVAKMGIIMDAEVRLDMRTLRNMIAHDYLYQEHQAFFEQLQKLYPSHISPMNTQLSKYMKKWMT